MGAAGDEVVIVGAGIAGLTAAWRLRQAGVGVRLFEAQNRVGGRMFSLRNHFPDGQVIELGGELIDTGHVRIRALAAELGLQLDDLLEDDGAHDTWFFDGRRTRRTRIVAAFVPVAAAIERDLALLGDDELTYHAPRRNPSPRAGARCAVDRAMARSQRRFRLAAQADRRGLHHRDGTGDRPAVRAQPADLHRYRGCGCFKVFGESDERFHVRGGNDLIVQGLGGKLDDAIETGSVLEAIRGDAAGYTLSFRRDGAARDVRARQVILALPFTLLRKVRIDVELPAAKRRSIERAGLRHQCQADDRLRRRIWREQQANGSVDERPALPDHLGNHPQAARRGGVLTNFTGGRHGVELGTGTPKAQAEPPRAALDRVFPGSPPRAPACARRASTGPSHPWSLGSYACFRRATGPAFRGAMGESVGGLHFAGEHCAPDTQGFMEGGCESGETAAQAVLGALGLAVAPATRQRRAA